MEEEGVIRLEDWLPLVLEVGLEEALEMEEDLGIIIITIIITTIITITEVAPELPSNILASETGSLGMEMMRITGT